jgi:putative ABC transport system substrate-binding protein
MLKEAAPGVSRAALMFNPDTAPSYYVYLHSFEAEPRSIAVEVAAAPVRNTAEVEKTIAKLGREPGGGLIVAPDAFTIVHHQLFTDWRSSTGCQPSICIGHTPPKVP